MKISSFLRSAVKVGVKSRTNTARGLLILGLIICATLYFVPGSGQATGDRVSQDRTVDKTQGAGKSNGASKSPQGITAQGGGCSILCSENITQASDPNNCGAVVNYPPETPITSGTCAPPVACSPPTGSFFPVGTSTVTCGENNATGPATCTFLVTIIDTQAPTITCPANVSQSNDPNNCGATVNYPAPTVSDFCPGVGMPVCQPPSGSFFPVGTTTVTCRVSDATTCENIFAVDEFNILLNFTASAPGTIKGFRTIGGLLKSEIVVGIDFRPATGQLYGLVRDTVTTGLRLVTIDVGTGATSQVGAAFAASGTDFGFDFNPTVDRIRITSDAETNLSVNPDTGQTTVQTPLNPGDPNVVGSAYTNNFVSATTTMLYAIDSGDDTLKTQNPPANGTLTPVGLLGVDTSGLVGFDISQCGGTAYAALNTTKGSSSLYTIDLNSGMATSVGTINVESAIRAMSIEMARTSYCSFTVTVNDTQPPSITCPANITAVAPQTCPPQTGVVTTFAPPTASDNCPGVVVACNPPSGSAFPVGTTTVTCTATDASGNTATCSFTVTGFNACLQDDANPNRVVLFNTFTGEYRFCCSSTVILTGRGRITQQGCVFTLQHNASDRTIFAKIDFSARRGNASLQRNAGPGCTISDTNIRDNTCQCGAAPAPPAG